MGSKFVGRILPATDRDKWWALVNMLMKLSLPQKAGNVF